MITVADAKAAGLTHKGTICGVPCYMANPDSNNPAIALKYPALQFYVDACDWLYDKVCCLIPDTWTLEFPIRPGARLE